MKALKYLRPESEPVNSISLVIDREREVGSNEDPPPIKRWRWVWSTLQNTARVFSSVPTEELPREFSPEEPLTRNYWEKKSIEWKL